MRGVGGEVVRGGGEVEFVRGGASGERDGVLLIWVVGDTAYLELANCM